MKFSEKAQKAIFVATVITTVVAALSMFFIDRTHWWIAVSVVIVSSIIRRTLITGPIFRARQR